MTCRSCGAEIAANALICYKCGTATQQAKIKPPAARRGLSRGVVGGLVILALVLAAVGRQVACGSLL